MLHRSFRDPLKLPLSHRPPMPQTQNPVAKLKSAKPTAAAEVIEETANVLCCKHGIAMCIVIFVP